MKLMLTILVAISYAAATYMLARAYFAAVVALYVHISVSWLRLTMFYILFLAFAFVAIVIIFLPGWLSEKLALFPRSPNGTAILILVGALTLVLSLWFASRTKVGRRASQLVIGKASE
jgi:hypothetical protein